MEKKKKKKEWKSRKFEIFGTKWKIIFTEKVFNQDDNFLFGVTVDECRTIYISTKNSKGDTLPDWEIRQTVAHECVHAILNSGQFQQESDNEPLVEYLGRGFLSLIKNKVFDYEKD